DRRLHLGEQALDVVAREEVALQAVVETGPEPGPLLLAPPALERAARAEFATVVLDDRPDLVHPPALERAHGHHRRVPAGARVAEEAQRAPVLRRGLLGGPHVLAVGLVDGDRKSTRLNSSHEW